MREEFWSVEAGPGGGVLPVGELQGSGSGPAWLLAAGVHGDEYEGPAVVRGVMSRLAAETFAGSVLALPIMNPMAYTFGTRNTPIDSGNLNRTFAIGSRETFTERWAAWLWQAFVMRCDRLIDLHAGGVTWQFEPVAGVYGADDLALAECLGLTLWQLPDTPGVLSREFRRARGSAVGAELGYGGVRDDALVERVTTSIVDLICGRGQRKQSPIYRHTDVFSRNSGEWIVSRQIATEVAEGEVIGIVSDWTGDVVEEVRSPLTGRILALRRLVSLQAGEMVAVVGTS